MRRRPSAPGFLAGIATGVWADEHEVASVFSPEVVVEPVGSFDRERWSDAVSRAHAWYPDLSGLDF